MTTREKEGYKMPGKEKVIKGLETCEISGTREDCERYGCPYFIYNDEVSDDCQITLFGDALALLKAQDPAKPVKVNRYMDTDENGDWYVPETYDCGNCGVELHDKANYCHSCGKKVKWGG